MIQPDEISTIRPSANQAAEFYYHPVPLDSNGRVVDSISRESVSTWKNELYVRIMGIGQKNNHSVKVTDENIKEMAQRFPRAWSEFQATDAEALDGTPVKQLPGINPALAKELELLKVQTIEQLAELGEGSVDRIPQGRKLQKTAKAYLLALESMNEPEPEIEIDTSLLTQEPEEIKPAEPKGRARTTARKTTK